MQNTFSKIGLLTGGALLASASFGFASGEGLAAQEISLNAKPAVDANAIAQFPPLPAQKEPDAFLNLDGSTININLVNTAPGVISYILPGTGEYRMLEPNEEAYITGLNVPAQIGFRQLDGGITYAEVSAVDAATNSATIQLSHVAAPELSRRSIAIDEYGAIYLD